MVQPTGDAVLQQLREELLARLWAMHAISPSPLTGVTRADTVARVGLVAARWSTLLRDPDPANRRRAASALERILWPAFSAPADEWWTTPLGDALAAIRNGASSAPTRDVTPHGDRRARDLVAH
jgi:hypothetical protein